MTTLIPQYDLMNGGSTPIGAVNRPFNQKLQEKISVKDFGAVADGVTDDTAAIQAAINAAGDRDVYFPAGSYGISSSLVLPTSGIRLVGEGAAAGTGAGQIIPLGTNYTSSAFAIFTVTANCPNVIMENLRLIGGGYGIFVNAATGYVDKLYIDNCVFQANLTASISCQGSSANGIYESVITRTTFVTCGVGINCSGPFNINRIENCSFEQMTGSYLVLSNASANPQSAVHFLRNRCETVGSSLTGPCLNLTGLNTFNVAIEGNYFENVFTNIINATNVSGMRIVNNFQTNSALVTGLINITNCYNFDIIGNATASGINVIYSGTITPGIFYGNGGGFNNGNYRSITNTTLPMFIPGAGLSLDTAPNIYSSQTNLFKAISLSNNVTATFFTFTGGTSSAIGYPSRVGMMLKALVLLNITDAGGVNRTASNQYLITVTGFSGATFTSAITTVVDQTSGNFTLTQSSAGTQQLIISGKYNSGTGNAFASNSRANILYEWVADEYLSSGISVA